MCHANNEKWKTTNDRKNRTAKSRNNQNVWRKDTHEYFGILKVDTIKTWTKQKIKKWYFSRTRKLLEAKLHSRSIIKVITTWAVSFEWLSGSFLKWKRKELRQMDHRTRKPMTMYKTLHPISTKFRLICPPAFFRCSLNSRTDTELRTTSFIQSTGVSYSDSVNHNRV